MDKIAIVVLVVFAFALFAVFVVIQLPLVSMNQTAVSPTAPTITATPGFTPTAGNAGFRKAPYLIYTDNNTQMIVLWQANETPGISVIEWGRNERYGEGRAVVYETGNGSNEHQFSYLLSDLTPSELVYYRVVVDNVQYDSSFHAAPYETQPSLVFYAYGDTRSAPESHNTVVAEMMRDMEQHAVGEPTLVLHAGDLVGSGMNEESWDNELFTPQSPNVTRMLACVPLIAALGNHERDGLVYKKYFPYPMYPTSHFYYSFDYGPVHFAVIDTYTTAYGNGSAQQAWLRRDLSSSNKPFKIVLFHHPAWTATCDGGSHAGNKIIQSDLTPIFEETGVQVVVQGHDHYYARSVSNEISYLTVGGGGAPLGEPNASCPKVVKTVKKHSFARFEVNGIWMNATVISKDGEVIDSFGVVTPVD